jgi:glycosyltransferase involved in cell wall biosynthesis
VGRHWSTDPRCKALFCGVPLDKFNLYLGGQSKVEYRKAHGIPEEAIVIGHAGSMGPSHVKNHPFILKVFAELARRSQHYYLYLAGDGPHRTDLLKIVKELGLQSRVIMPGLCDDVPSLMVHGFDVHLLPSFWEGLPVAGLEAVASGLFTVCSDSITKDFTDYFSERVVTVSLKADINIWADEVMEGVSKRLPTRQGVALVENSPFSIQTSCRELTDVYQNSLQKIGKNCLLAEQLM